MIAAALGAIEAAGMRVLAVSPVRTTAPLGPSRRRYANAAALVETKLLPAAALSTLKRVERAFGRRAGGRPWAARVLDLDLVLWSGGCWSSAALTIPHPEFRHRDFVLGPACAVTPAWRDPLTGLTLRQLRARLTRPRLRS